MLKNLRLFFSAAFLVLLIFCFDSCSKKVIFPTSSIVPAAVGNVKIKKDHNKNFAIRVNIQNLPEPKRLNPPRNYYVVWSETRNNVKNLGRIVTSSGFLSSKMKASLNAISPTRPHRIFITAENDEYARYPGNMVVLDTGDF